VELTVVMPCLNEAETVATCVRKAVQFIADSGISGEVVVADNGSTDGSRQLAADGAPTPSPQAAKGKSVLHLAPLLTPPHHRKVPSWRSPVGAVSSA